MKSFHVKSKGTKLDFTQTAAAVVSQAIGEGVFDGKPLSDPDEGKDPQAIEQGRAGGLKARERESYCKCARLGIEFQD
jgi:hypothetical protein